MCDFTLIEPDPVMKMVLMMVHDCAHCSCVSPSNGSDAQILHTEPWRGIKQHHFPASAGQALTRAAPRPTTRFPRSRKAALQEEEPRLLPGGGARGRLVRRVDSPRGAQRVGLQARSEALLPQARRPRARACLIRGHCHIRNQAHEGIAVLLEVWVLKARVQG